MEQRAARRRSCNQQFVTRSQLERADLVDDGGGQEVLVGVGVVHLYADAVGPDRGGRHGDSFSLKSENPHQLY